MKKLLPFIICFITLISFGQNRNETMPLEKNGLYTTEFLADLSRESISLNGNGFPELKSILNSEIKKTNFQSFQKNNKTLSKKQDNSLRLDRSVLINFVSTSLSSKVERTYDENGKITLRAYYRWDVATESFVPNYKYEKTYDANGREILFIYYQWDIETQFFLPGEKSEDTYDENGITSIGYRWDKEIQSFLPSWKTEITVDENGNRTLSINYQWDKETQSFVPYSKTETTFDENDNPIISVSYSWNTATSSFVPKYKTEQAYHANGELTLLADYSWNVATESWVPSFRFEGTMDSNGNFTLAVFYNSYETNGPLFPNGKTKYTYDANRNLTVVISYEWDRATESFVATRKDEYTYDVNGKKTLWTTYKWYAGLGVYKPSFKQAYSTVLDNETKLVRMGTIFKYDTNFNKWEELVGEEYKSYWYYTKTSTLATDEFNSNLFAIYPNPTSDYINIETKEGLSNLQFELFDISGKSVLSQPINSTELIDIQNLTPSIYFYCIKDGKSLLKSGKVIKK
jgi:hypothetical protein